MDTLEQIKEDILKRENNLSEFACKSPKGIRLVPEEEDIRPSFFRDVDRIVHSFTYTRYMDKTQVFPMTNDDRVTRRMIHVQLVSKVARTIGRALNLNEDLIESTALGHDVGHVPFGHEGERILDEISQREGEGYFNHNVQSARMLMSVENNGKGCNLTLQTLDGILCHNGELLKEVYEPQYSKNWDKFLEEYNNCYTSKEQLKALRAMTLEGCVTRVSDIIGYIGRDIEDAIDLGVISREELPESIINILGNSNKSIVNELILDVIEHSYNKPYLSISAKVYDALNDLKKFNYEHIYKKALTDEQREEIKIMFNQLYNVYLADLETVNNETNITKMFLKSMNEDYLKNTSKKRMVIDYIAGMTDKYFVDQYKALIKKENA